MITALGLKRKINRITSSLKPYKIRGNKFYSIPESANVCVIDFTVKDFDSHDGIEYFVIGTVSKVAKSRIFDEIYIKNMLFSCSASTFNLFVTSIM